METIKDLAAAIRGARPDVAAVGVTITDEHVARAYREAGGGRYDEISDEQLDRIAERAVELAETPVHRYPPEACIVCRKDLTGDCMPALFGPGFTCRRCGEKARRNLADPDAAVARAAKATSRAAAVLGRKGGQVRGPSKARAVTSEQMRAVRAKRVSVYGYRNVAYYPGPRAEGYAVWYPTRALRDEALRSLRAEAIAHGLTGSASLHGIYPIVQSIRLLTDDQREDLTSEGNVRTA